MPNYGLSVSMVDFYGRAANKRFEVVADTQPDAMTLAGEVVGDLAAITGLRILSYTVAETVVYTDVVTSGANRDAGLTVSVRTEDNEKAVIKIPGPEAGIFNTDGTLDLTDGGWAAFAANYLAGDVLVDDGETVTEIISGRLDK